MTPEDRGKALANKLYHGHQNGWEEGECADAIRTAVEAAVKETREECADICARVDDDRSVPKQIAVLECIRRIRARNKT